MTDPLLAPFDGLLAALARIGAPLTALDRHALPFGGVGLALVVLGMLLSRTGGARRSTAAGIATALGLAWIGQLCLLLDSVFFGVACYALAVAFALRVPADEPLPRGRATTFDFAVGGLGVAAYLVLSLWHLDVRPELDFDEFAYLQAVLISAGKLPATEQIGRIYELARFEALPLALGWQSAWVALVGPDVLATRLASVAACGLALAAGAATIRSRLGSRAAALGLLFGATAPLLLAYSRLGLQISGSILHGTVAIGLWFFVRARFRPGPAAALLGIVSGASLFLYQLSWFVPVLAVPALAFAAWRDGGRAPWRAVALVVLCSGVVFASGAVLLRAEFATLWAQTESRRTWQSDGAREPGEPGEPGERGERGESGESARLDDRDRTGGQERFILPGAASQKQARYAARGIHGDGVETWMARTDSGAWVLGLIGDASARAPLAQLARLRGWRPLTAGGASPLGAVAHALGFLFRDAHLQNPDALIDAPTLRPLLAPLLVVGLARLLKRRATRSLAGWILAATFVPVLVAGAETRRVVLALPLLFAAAAWPLAELLFVFETRKARLLTLLAASILCAALAASGVHLALDRWDQRVEITRTPVRMLALARVLAGLPERERVLIPRGMLTNAFGSSARLAAGMLAAPEARRRFVSVGAAEISGADGLLRASCAEPLPFTWIVPPRDDAKLRFKDLDRDFVLERRNAGELQLLRVLERRPGGCRQ